MYMYYVLCIMYYVLCNIMWCYVSIDGSQGFDIITQFINQRYSIPFHLSEQKAFLSFLAFLAIAMRKSLPKQLTHQINQM